MDSKIVLHFDGGNDFTVHCSAPDDALARLVQTRELKSVYIETAQWEPVTEVKKTFLLAPV